MIDNALFKEAIIKDYRLFRCPLSGDVLKENSGELLSEHEQTRFTVYDGIPDFAALTIQSTLKEEVQEFWDCVESDQFGSFDLNK